MFFLCSYRKRSPKSEDDGFVFPEINLEKPSDKCDLDALTKQQSQKSTATAPATQHHVFAEPKPVSCIYASVPNREQQQQQLKKKPLTHIHTHKPKLLNVTPKLPHFMLNSVHVSVFDLDVICICKSFWNCFYHTHKPFAKFSFASTRQRQRKTLKIASKIQFYRLLLLLWVERLFSKICSLFCHSESYEFPFHNYATRLFILFFFLSLQLSHHWNCCWFENKNVQERKKNGIWKYTKNTHAYLHS